MEVTIYYAKINLRTHILEVYKGEKDLDRILEQVANSIRDGISYKQVDNYQNNDSNDIIYTFNNIIRLDESLNKGILGNITKESYIFAKQRDEFGKRKKIRMKNEEEINFYFDIMNEVLAFHTTKRFGHRQFINAMKVLINKSINTYIEEEKYIFDIELLRKAIDLLDIKQELLKIDDLSQLKINIIPPNPNKELLSKIRSSAETQLEEMTEANLTGESIIFESDAPGGLKIGSKIIDEKLSRVESLHTHLTGQDAIRNGYLKVSAKSKSGRSYSSNDREPVKDKIQLDEGEYKIEFANRCFNKLKSVFKL